MKHAHLRNPRFMVSIHDVMPHTLAEVQDILALLADYGIPPVTLLVVPDTGWSDREVNVLHDFQTAGHKLAGHGWKHQCVGPKTVAHTIHSLILSRNVAEHLSRGSHHIAALIETCFQWFARVGLRPPTLYVPPAWAMGPVSRQVLADLPFRMYEYLTGIYDSHTGQFLHLPLVGYEADKQARVWSLRFFNKLNHTVARLSDRPLRIAIHPYDFTSALASDLHSLLMAVRLNNS